MARIVSKGKGSFVWQAGLIVAPMLVLVILGVVSLRQDRSLAQHEAAERAQSLADSLLPRLWAGLMKTDDPRARECAFAVNAAGELQFPPPYADAPIPKPFNSRELTQEQARLWRDAGVAEVSNMRVSEAIKSYRDFLALKPPAHFAAAAHYALGLLLTRTQAGDAAKEFELLAQRYPHATGESGLPLSPLAELKLIELAASATNQTLERSRLFNRFCSNVIYAPSALTPQLLEQAAQNAKSTVETNDILKWQQLWNQQEFSRQLFMGATSHFHLKAVQPGALQVLTDPSASPPAALRAAQIGLFWFTLADGVPQTMPNQAVSLGLSNQEEQWLAIRIANTNEYPMGQPVNVNQRSNSIVVADAPNIWYLQTMANLQRLGGTNLNGERPTTLEDSNRPPSTWFVCRSDSEVRSGIATALQQASRIPEYFGIGVEVASNGYLYEKGQVRNYNLGELPPHAAVFQQRATNILASAGIGETGEPEVRVSVLLTNPSLLFHRQRARSLWFGCLIAVSAGTALLGLNTTWRAFNRQQRLNELKSNFVSSVSHELRAPIASVRLLAESLERGRVSETQKQREYFHFIGQECRRLSALIENVLDFSRIEQGRKQYEFEPTDLLALVRQTVELMQTYAAEKGVAIEFEVEGSGQPQVKGTTTMLPPHPSPLPLGGGDPQPALSRATIPPLPRRGGKGRGERAFELSIDGRAIQQAVVNLIDNAIKHSPKDEKVMVTVGNSGGDRSDAVTRHPALITISVEDRGPGIPPEEHEKIFERFYRLGPELRRQTQGVGIGLSIVKHIVEAHGGRVLVRSAVGQGSRFTIELPLGNEKSEVRSAT